MEAEVVERATDLLEVSVDVSRLGSGLKGLHDHVTTVRESVQIQKQQLHGERSTVNLLRRRKHRLRDLKQACESSPTYHATQHTLSIE